MLKNQFDTIKKKIAKMYRNDASNGKVKHSYLFVHGVLQYSDSTCQFCTLQMDKEGYFDDIEAILDKIPYQAIDAFSLFWDTDNPYPSRISAGIGEGAKLVRFWSESEYQTMQSQGLPFKKKGE